MDRYWPGESPPILLRRFRHDCFQFRNEYCSVVFGIDVGRVEGNDEIIWYLRTSNRIRHEKVQLPKDFAPNDNRMHSTFEDGRACTVDKVFESPFEASGEIHVVDCMNSGS